MCLGKFFSVCEVLVDFSVFKENELVVRTIRWNIICRGLRENIVKLGEEWLW